MSVARILGAVFVWTTWPLIVPVWCVLLYTKETHKPFFEWYRTEFW